MSFFKDKVVLVTGAGGSIGSELCRQLASYGDLKTLILFDSSELALYNIDRELGGKGVPVLGDVSRPMDVDRLFSKRDIDTVFHTAAYKHVTLCENNQVVAERVNVFGTAILVRTAREFSVPRLILISTDKAVRPTSVMGRTKQQAEEIVREANYTVVRLGNVWGSSGSVIPLWVDQINAGLPVTITHPRATRYFIDDEKVADVILRVAEKANGGEVFVPEMGQALNLVEVARGLGATEFKYIGLRPGEKLHEELFVGERGCTIMPGIWEDAA